MEFTNSTLNSIRCISRIVPFTKIVNDNTTINNHSEVIVTILHNLLSLTWDDLTLVAWTGSVGRIVGCLLDGSAQSTTLIPNKVRVEVSVCTTHTGPCSGNGRREVERTEG